MRGLPYGGNRGYNQVNFLGDPPPKNPKLSKTPIGGREAAPNGYFAKFGLSSTGLSTGESNYFVCDLATQEIRCVHLDACLGL